MDWRREEQLYGLEKRGIALWTGEERNSSMDKRREEQLHGLEKRGTSVWTGGTALWIREETNSSVDWAREGQLCMYVDWKRMEQFH